MKIQDCIYSYIYLMTRRKEKDILEENNKINIRKI